MLDSIEIRNFRSVETVELRLGEPVIALIGKNGAGKTNLLHAIHVAAELCFGNPDPLFRLAANDGSRPTEFVVRFAADGACYLYRVSRAAFPNEDSAVSESLERDGRALFTRKGRELTSSYAPFESALRVPLGIPGLWNLMQVLPREHALFAPLSAADRWLRGVRYFQVQQQFQEHAERAPVSLVDASRYEQWKQSLDQSPFPDSVMLRLVHMHLAERRKLDELRSLLGDDGLGLVSRITIEEIDVPDADSNGGRRSDYLVTFTPCGGIAGGGRSFKVGGLSAGTWRIIQLLTYLVFDEASCMLVEQPEDSIHAGLLGKLLDIFRTYAHRTQLICTTHSARVIDLIGPEGVRLVTVDGVTTEVAELTPEDVAASQSYLADEGTLAEFLETL